MGKFTTASYRAIIGKLTKRANYLVLQYEKGSGDDPTAPTISKDVDFLNDIEIKKIVLPARSSDTRFYSAGTHGVYYTNDAGDPNNMQIMFTVLLFTFEIPFLDRHYKNRSLFTLYYRNRYKVKATSLVTKVTEEDDIRATGKLPGFDTIKNAKKGEVDIYDEAKAESCLITQLSEVEYDHTSEAGEVSMDVTMVTPNITYTYGEEEKKADIVSGAGGAE